MNASLVRVRHESLCDVVLPDEPAVASWATLLLVHGDLPHTLGGPCAERLEVGHGAQALLEHGRAALVQAEARALREVARQALERPGGRQHADDFVCRQIAVSSVAHQQRQCCFFVLCRNLRVLPRPLLGTQEGAEQDLEEQHHGPRFASLLITRAARGAHGGTLRCGGRRGGGLRRGRRVGLLAEAEDDAPRPLRRLIREDRRLSLWALPPILRPRGPFKFFFNESAIDFGSWQVVQVLDQDPQGLSVLN
mmetsp:Transcript_49674/g.142519  ORF Transcript_49674/g.142519 Transcript_49674/m.142519 type:complete len:251 (+) Transcript_49674:136-888(+)